MIWRKFVYIVGVKEEYFRLDSDRSRGFEAGVGIVWLRNSKDVSVVESSKG